MRRFPSVHRGAGTGRARTKCAKTCKGRPHLQVEGGIIRERSEKLVSAVGRGPNRHNAPCSPISAAQLPHRGPCRPSTMPRPPLSTGSATPVAGGHDTPHTWSETGVSNQTELLTTPNSLGGYSQGWNIAGYQFRRRS
jgi:hypothetical protein